MFQGSPTLDRRQLLRIFGAVAAAGATGGLAACTSDNSNRQRQLSGLTIRVGLVVPSTGPLAGIGEDVKRAFNLYLDSNDQLLGPHRVDLQLADEGETPEAAVAAVNGLLERGVVAIVGIANPDALPPVALIMQEKRVPLVAVNAAPGTLTNAVFVWRTSSVQGDAGKALAAFALRQGPRAYLMYENTSTGNEEAAKFETDFVDLNGTIINNAPGFSAPSSISAKLADARNRGADSIFACYSGDQAAEVLRNHYDLGITIPLLGTESLTETTDLAALGPGLPKPVYTSSFYAPDLDNDANRRFVTAYHRAYGLQATSYAMAAYDSAGVLSRALTQVPGDPKGPQINEAFSALGQIESPRGTWTFNINRSPQQKWYLRRLTLDGRVPSNLLDSDLMVLG